MGSVCIFFGENILLLLFYCYSSPVPFGGRFHARMKICLQKGTNGACELQHFEKVVDKRYSGAIQYDQVEKLSTHKIRQDVFRKEDVLPSPHKDSIPADFVSAGFLFMIIECSQSVHSIVSDNRTITEHVFCHFLSFIPRISVSRRTICLELSC